MKVEKYDSTQEKMVLTAMVTDKVVLGRVAAKWADEMFPDRWSNLIADWCVDYHRRLGEAPGEAITGLFTAWAGVENRDKDTVEAVEKFLRTLSDAFERETPLNPDYLTEMAADCFNRAKMSRLADAVKGHLSMGRIGEAKAIFQGFAPVDMGSDEGKDLFRDKEAVASTFDGPSTPLVTYPDAVGRFFGSELTRDSLVAFMGPEKSGKSFWLIDLAFRAVLQRKRVAFFEVGDMSERQISTRFLTRVARNPARSPDGKWPYEVKIPTAIRPSREFSEPADVDSDVQSYDRPLDYRSAWKACRRLMMIKVKSNNSYFRMKVYPNSTVNVAGIRSALQGLVREGWVPDVIVIDYADILAAPAGNMEVRDQINTTWKQLRALSQETRCLVVTATQADAESYDKALLGKRNFSEDKRKLSHATGVVGINVTHAEKEAGITRLNWIVLREGEFSHRRCVHVAGCLPIANPCVVSSF